MSNVRSWWASFVLGVETVRNRSLGLLGLPQRSYIDPVFKQFDMQNCSHGEGPIIEGDEHSVSRSPKTKMKRTYQK